MSKIQVTLRPSSDGSIRLQVPSELRSSPELRVVAWIEAASENGEPVRKSGAGEWAVHARGVAKPFAGETADEARLDSIRKQFDLQ
jgi:hypothetical protein